LGQAVLVSIYACFFLSGATGLIYEIVWMRMLGLVFGHTVFAITTVLVSFMAGLALGASLFGKRIDAGGRPLRVYGLLEAGIGLFCLLIPALFTLAQHLYLALYRTMNLSLFGLTLTQFVLAFFILLVPTTLMGATLPVLGKLLVERLEGVGQKIGELYGVNILGAVAGSVAAGFFLLPAIGVSGSILLAAAINLAIAAAALLIDRGLPQPTPLSSQPSRRVRVVAPDVEKEHLARAGALVILLGIGLSGTASMIYEVAWTRVLSLTIGSSIYAFSAMLSTFLAGLGLGSFLFAKVWGRREIGLSLFGWLEVAAGLAALAMVPLMGRLPDLVLALLTRLSLSVGGTLLTQFGLSFLVMIVPTTIIGGTFPCAVRLCTRALARLGRDVGQVYSANTVGTILGALVAGFALIPWIGPQASILGAAALNVGVGVAALVVSAAGQPIWRRSAVGLMGLILVVGAAFLPPWDRRMMIGGASIYVPQLASQGDPLERYRRIAAARELLFYRDGINATVTVERSDGIIGLRVGGKVDATNGRDMATQLLVGHLPILLHPRPERVLVIGLGSGVTAGAVAQHPAVREIDVVELEPAVEAASHFFTRENRGVLRDPRVRLVIGDGRNFILATPKRYDVISSQPSNPWIAGMANLFSLDFYRLARERLADDGVMVQWLQGYALFPDDVKMILNTFIQVFPHSTLWRTLLGDYLLVGTVSPLRVDYTLIERRFAASPGIREDMSALRFASPVDLLTLFLLDEAALGELARGARINTDDRPILEFAAPMALYADTIEKNHRLLRQARSPRPLPIANLPERLLEARRLDLARVYWARGEREEALEQLRLARPPASGDLRSLIERAKLLFSLGEVAQATDEFSRLISSRPQDRVIKSYLTAGARLHELRLEEEMARHSRTKLGDPNPAEAQINLGVFYTQAGVRYKEPAFFDVAIDVLQVALQTEPESLHILTNLGNAYFGSGRLDEAARVYGRVIEKDPKMAEARFNLGLLYEKQGRLDRAIREFEAAAAARPNWGLPRMHLRAAQEALLSSGEAGKGARR